MGKKQRGSDDPIDETPLPPLSMVRGASGGQSEGRLTAHSAVNATPSVEEPEAAAATAAPPTQAASNKNKKRDDLEAQDKKIKDAARRQMKSRAANVKDAPSASSPKPGIGGEDELVGEATEPEPLTTSATAKAGRKARKSPTRKAGRSKSPTPADTTEGDSAIKRRARSARTAAKNRSKTPPKSKSGAPEEDIKVNSRAEQKAAASSTRVKSKSPVRPAMSVTQSKRIERESRRAARNASKSPNPPASADAVGVGILTKSSRMCVPEEAESDDFEFEPGAVRVGGSLSNERDSLDYGSKGKEEDSTRSKKSDDGIQRSKASTATQNDENGAYAVPTTDLESQSMEPVVAHLAPDDDDIAKQITERVQAEVNKHLQNNLQMPSDGKVVQAAVVERVDESKCCCWSKGGLLVLVLVGVAIIVTIVVVMGGSSSNEPTVKTTLAPVPSPTLSPTASPTQNEFSLRFNELYDLIGSDVSATPETTLRDLSTAQNAAMVWLADSDTAGIDFATEPKQALIERYALAVIYESTDGGDSWRSSLNFLSARPTCSWNDASGTPNDMDSGAICSNSMVTTLNLQRNDLEGTLPTEIGLLSSLQVLSLGENRLGGTIPTELFALTGLDDLDLAENLFIGTLPTEIGQLTNLRRDFRIHRNNLNGPLPSELGLLSMLREMRLFENAFTGTISLDFFRGLRSLISVDMGDNDLSGSLPTEIGFMSSLEREFRVSHNLRVTGTLPTELGHLTRLQALSARDCSFFGTMPTELGFMTSLTSIGVQSSDLSGEIPSEIGRLSNLESFRMSGNRDLSGRVPMEFIALSALTRFEAGSTNLSGGFEEVFCDITVRPQPLGTLQADCGGQNPDVECSCCTRC